MTINSFAPAKTERSTDLRVLDAIAARMVAEYAADLSDAEIERTLFPCVAGPRLIPMAKRLRNTGDLELRFTYFRMHREVGDAHCAALDAAASH